VQPGDLIKYRDTIRIGGNRMPEVYIVRRIEHKNSWVFVVGHEVPINMNLMEVFSESR
jgi:hypothetical protein